MRQPEKHGEPWSCAAKKSAAYEDPFPGNTADGLDQEAVGQARDAAKRCADRAEWLVWAAGVHEPGPAKALVSGETVAFDDRGIVGRFNVGVHGTRAAECVNALRGVSDPVAWVDSVRELLCEIVGGATRPDGSTVSGGGISEAGQDRALALLAALPRPED
jgi:hypothetical protein